MTDDAELEGLDPFDLLDEEAARLDAYYSALPAGDWSKPSRAEGWTYRDMLAHLASNEDYHRASLEGTVSEFLARLGAAGATDLDSANTIGIDRLAHLERQELLAVWRQDNAETRAGFRERGDGAVDTTVGNYPCRWQAFHLASELATHADDVHLPVADAERDRRRAWRARFSRFALAEAKPNVTISVEGDRTRVAGDGVEVDVDDDALIEGAMGRLDDSSGLTEAQLDLLRAG